MKQKFMLRIGKDEDSLKYANNEIKANKEKVLSRIQYFAEELRYAP